MSNGLTFQCGGGLTVPGVQVELIHVPDCPNVAVARERILDAGRGLGVSIALRVREVADQAEAAAAGMRGSPTVLVGGVDVAGDGMAATSVSCRLYADSGGAPDVEAIAAALRSAREGAAGPDAG